MVMTLLHQCDILLQFIFVKLLLLNLVKVDK